MFLSAAELATISLALPTLKLKKKSLTHREDTLGLNLRQVAGGAAVGEINSEDLDALLKKLTSSIRVAVRVVPEGRPLSKEQL